MALATQIKGKEHKNPDVIENVIHYITRTRPNETQAADLLLWGTEAGYTYHPPVDNIIAEFKKTQKYYYHRYGTKICHYSIEILPMEFHQMGDNIYVLGDYAVACCRYLYNMGFQTCFAIHYSDNGGFHIHLAINTVSFRTGYKLRQYYKEVKRNIEGPLLAMLKDCCYCRMDFSSMADL